MKPVPKTVEKSNRLVTLDYLRGFFIVVIIIDHFSRWPSALELLSGRALLWVTAAEGFVAISGLLVGYIRGFKNQSDSMQTVAQKLWKRAGLLYLWSLIASIGYTAILWYLPLIGGAPTMPIAVGDWGDLIFRAVTLQYTYVWIHFLTLYAIFLAFAPLTVYLLRRGLAWLVVALSIGALILGWATHIEALQWQVIFFIPSVAGYYLPTISKWWQQRSPATQRTLTVSVLFVTAATILLSVICTFYPTLMQQGADALNSLFAKDTISVWRALLAFTWFTGFILLFRLLGRWIGRWFGWMLLPFGTRSLTAYILHGLVICFISYLTLGGEEIIPNTILGVACIVIVWGLLKVPFIRQIVPS